MGTTTTQTLGWGFMGTSAIAATVAREVAAAGDGRLVAVLSRSSGRSQAFAAEAGFARAYSDQREFLADPDVQAVYVALPNNLHVEAVLAALDAGKHVMCEKPMVTLSEDARRIASHPNASRLCIAEGFMVRHQPQWTWVEEQIAAGRVGQVRAVHYLSALGRAPGVTNQLLHDVGCYAVHLMRMIFGGEPLRVASDVVYNETNGSRVNAMMEFAAGHAFFTMAETWRATRRIHILGTEGSIELFTPIHPAPGPARILASFKDDGNTEPQEFLFPAVPQYGRQMSDFANAVLSGGKPKVSIDNAVGNAQTMDAILSSAKSGGAWVSL